MKFYKLIFKIGTKHTSQWIKSLYDEGFADDFNHVAKGYLRITLENMKDPHVIVYPLNFAFAPAYIAWYKSAKLLRRSEKEAEEILWKMSESIVNHFPKFLFKVLSACYLESARKNGPKQKILGDEGKVGPSDFLIDYRDIDENTFQIRVKRCAIMILAKEFEAEGIFPAACMMGSMFTKRIDVVRNKSLGKGDDCLYTVRETAKNSEHQNER